MSDEWKKMTLELLKKTSDSASKLAGDVKKGVEASRVREKVDTIANQTKSFLDEKGITENLQKVTGVVGDHFDTISGQKVFELVQQRLDLQAHYNDILATKLEEALSRISVLESSIAQTKSVK